MHVAFGRVRRKIALLRTGFSLMRTVYSEMVSVVSFQFNMDKKPLAELTKLSRFSGCVVDVV